jgi:hypothetical protein
MRHLLWVIGLIALAAFAWFLYRYMYHGGNNNDLIVGGISGGIALVCFAIFFFIRIRQEADEEISITKF